MCKIKTVKSKLKSFCMPEKTFANEKEYDSSPLVEAVCQFHFSNFPNLMPFDKFVELRKVFSSEFPFLDESVVSEVKNLESTDNFIESRRFRKVFKNYNSDRTRFIQFGDLLFTINFLKPYISWGEFKPVIVDSIKKFNSILPMLKLNGFNLIYSNHFNLPPDSSLDLTEYFMFYPFVPPEIESIGKFSMNVLVPYNDSDRLHLELKDISEETPNILLQLSFVKMLNQEVEFDELVTYLDNCHSIIGSTFEQIITNKTRDLIGVKKYD